MVKEEVAYAMVTSHSIVKSRTGNILSRLISRTGLELEAGAVFSPSAELAGAFAASIEKHAGAGRGDAEADRVSRGLVARYLGEKFIDVDARAPRRRVLMLVFRGANAVERMRGVVGEIKPQTPQGGETIRDTYGEYMVNAGGEVVFFEPAVLIGESSDEVLEQLQLWASHAEAESGIREGASRRGSSPEPQRTLVLIKPDNFRFPNIRPGALIDVFSRTGLSIVGFKVHRMSVAEAEEFYRPVLPVLEEHFKSSHGERLKELVENEFSVRLSEGDHDAIAETVGPIIGRRYWENLVQFMSGKRPGEVTDSERIRPGNHKTIALVYEGENAVEKIREVLGPTDPSKAPAGTIRREFGTTVMINAAHASDSPENAEREMGLLGVGENVFEPFVEGLSTAEENEPDGLVKKIRNLFQ